MACIRVIPCIAAGLALVPAPLAAARTDDVRLAKTVSINAIGTNLERVSTVLTKQTGVRFRVRRDIGDEKIDIFVRDYRVGSLMDNIARLLHYRWTSAKGKDGTIEYLLYRDANTRTAQNAAKNAYAAWQIKHWTTALGHIKDVLAMSSDEVRQLPPDEFRWAAEARFESVRPWYNAFANLPMADLQQLFKDGRLIQPLTDGPPFDKTGLLASVPAQISEAFQGSNQIELISSHRWYQAVRPNSDGFVALIRGRDGAQLPRSVFLAPAAGKGDARIVDKDVAKKAENIFLPQDVTALADDSRLNKLVKPPPPTKEANTVDTVNFHTGLQRTAEATGVPIISDYYTTGQKDIPFNAQKAHNLLTLLCLHFGHQFSADGLALVFRHNEWPLMMDREIPLRTLDALGERGQKGEINFDQSLIAALLSVNQSQFLSLYGYFPRWISSEWQTAFYQFLACLSKAELRLITGSKGMRTTGLLPHRAAALNILTKARGTTVPPGGYISEMQVVREPLFLNEKAVSEAVRIVLKYSAGSASTTERLDMIVAPRKEWSTAPPEKSAHSLNVLSYGQSP